MKKLTIVTVAVLALCATGCNQDKKSSSNSSSSNSSNSSSSSSSSYVVNNQDTENPIVYKKMINKESKANIKGVKVSKDINGYKFLVSIESNDKGCNEYVDWWEVLDENGNLIYRRILRHSHVKEQPFTRAGVANVNISEGQTLYVRAHLNTKGYNGNLYKGAIKLGFAQTHENKNFDSSIESDSPQPSGCAF